MKNNKIVSIISVLLLITVFCSSCSKKQEEQVVKTADMLCISNYDQNYSGRLTRMYDVTGVTKKVIGILVNGHNSLIKTEKGDSFFESDKYIFSLFDPFKLKCLYYTEKFNNELTQEAAAELFKSEAGNSYVLFQNSDNDYVLKFVSEERTKLFEAAYDKKSDTLFYKNTEDCAEGINENEFITFVTVSDKEYLICSQNEKCYVKFNDDFKLDTMFYAIYSGNIVYEKTGLNNISLMITDNSFEDWVLKGNGREYKQTYIFKNRILSYSDFTGDIKREAEISYDNNASAFLNI